MAENRLRRMLQDPRVVEALLRFGESIVALIIGLAIGAAILYYAGYSPGEAYYQLFYNAVLDKYGLARSLAEAAPLILTGITFAVGVRAGLFNIGAEGQLYFGALGAAIVAWLAYKMPMLNSPLGTIAAYALGVILASLLALIAAVLKVWRGVHEVVSTIMLNWIAFWIVEFMRIHYLFDPRDATKTMPVPPGARLPILLSGSELSATIIVSVGFALLTYYLLWYTVMGYELRASGLSPKAARYAGIDPNKSIIVAFLVGGVAAGLAGAGEVLGRPPHYAITSGLSNLLNLGFDGITVALIGANHPIGVIFAGILLGVLKSGASYMQIFAGVPLEMVRIIEGVIVIALAVPGTLHMIREYLQRKKKLMQLRAEQEAGKSPGFGGSGPQPPGAQQQ